MNKTTKTAQFTPGPWTVQDSTDNDDDTTLTIYAPKDEASIAIMDAFENGCECFSEIRANATLIAAAPVMYADLCAVRDYLFELYDEGNAKAGEYAASLGITIEEAEGQHHE